MRPYIFRSGDSLARLATAHQFEPEVAWTDAKNAEVREARGAPSSLVAGDVVYIPDRPPENHGIELTRANSYVGSTLDAQGLSVMDFAGCAMTVGVSGALNLANWGPWVLIQSPLFRAGGSVVFALDRTPTGVKFNLGLAQTIVASSGVKATYTIDGGTRARTQYYQPMPVRDGSANTAPWYGAEAVKRNLDPHGGSKDAKDYVVDMTDQPQTAVVWELDQGKAKLARCEGFDLFCTWLALQRQDTGAIAWKCWATWVVEWSIEFEYARRGQKEGFARQTGVGAVLRGEGSGQGPYTPLTRNPVANDSKKVKDE